MNRSYKYLEYSQTIAESILFLQNAKVEKAGLETNLNEYLQIINSNKSIFLKFPSLIKEIQSALNIEQFNAETGQGRIDSLKATIIKLTYIYHVLNDIEEINNPVLEERVTLSAYKAKFINSANSLLFRSVDTLHFEVEKFEQLFKKNVLQLNEEKKKCEKVRSLLGQDLPLISQFPFIETEIRNISEGQIKGSIGADYVITNYAAIRENLSKLNEFSKYFSRLSKDYLMILSGYDLQIFQKTKTSLSLSNISGEFIRLNSKASEYKNKMIKLDTLRNHVNNLRKDINEKIGDLSPNHQSYVRDEMLKIQELLFEKIGIEFEKADAKINTIKEVLKKEFKSNDQRATDSLFIRQTIVRYENNIWQEDLTSLFEELNNFVAGKSGWTKDEFSNATQRFIRQKNEIIESIKTQFQLYFSKNREYKNKFEKIANTKSTKKELEELINEMSAFKPLKNIFYKYIK